jgi:hypothetical protein
MVATNGTTLANNNDPDRPNAAICSVFGVAALWGFHYVVIEEIYYVIKNITFTNLIKCSTIPR